MKTVEDEFKSLIKKEKLNDFANYFNDYESYEEIPLFTRYKNISFLSDFSFNEKNKILILKGLELLRSIRMMASNYLNESEMKNYFICLTITSWDLSDYNEINCLSPNICVSRKKQWLLSCLELTQKNSIEENIIKEYLYSLNLANRGVYVTKKTASINRVYILDKPID